jgi:hypothetical protein
VLAARCVQQGEVSLVLLSGGEEQLSNTVAEALPHT